MKQSNSSGNVHFLEWVRRLWAPISGFIGAVTLVGNLIELWRRDQITYNWIFAALCFLILLFILAWAGFSRNDNLDSLMLPQGYNHFRPRYPSLYQYARYALGLVGVIVFVVSIMLYYQLHVLADKVIVLVTGFEGVESQRYRVTEIVWENLNSVLKEYDDVQLILLENVPIKSYEEAKIVGKKYNATIVIWGWYAITNESVRVVAHFDILKQPGRIPASFTNQKEIKDAGIAELQHFVLQDQLSDKMIYLSLATVGFVRYSLRDWDGAISSFTSALDYTSNEDAVQRVQFYIDQTYDAQIAALPDFVEIFIAAENIPQGGTINESLLNTITIPKNQYIRVMYMLSEKEILLDDNVARFPLDQGVIITRSMIVKRIEAVSITGPTWASLIPPGVTTVVPIYLLNDTTGKVIVDTLACYKTASDLSDIVFYFTRDDTVTLVKRDTDTNWILVEASAPSGSCWIYGPVVFIDVEIPNIK